MDDTTRLAFVLTMAVENLLQLVPEASMDDQAVTFAFRVLDEAFEWRECAEERARQGRHAGEGTAVGTVPVVRPRQEWD